MISNNEEALELVQKCLDDWPYAATRVVDIMTRLERVKVLLKEQHEAVEQNEWIKCSDRMPEEQETIFAKFKGTDKWSPAMFAQSSEDVRVVIVFADGTRRVSHSHTIDGKWECEKSPVKRTVTHWMPNPELPKDGD